MDILSSAQNFTVLWENHFEELTAALKHFAHCSILTDFSFLAEKESISMHHVILSCFTLYYEQMANNGSVQYFVHTEQKKFILQALVDFIYTGVVNVPNECSHQLEHAAASLRIQGSSAFDDIVIGVNETIFKWPKHRDLFSHKIWELRQSPSQCDVMFTINNEYKAYAHTCILAACSPFLLQMFTNHCLERRRPYVVALHNVQKVGFDLVMEYCYKGEINISLKDIPSVYNVADILGVHSLCHKLTALCPLVSAPQPGNAEIKRSVNIIRTSAIPTAMSDLLKYERLVDVFLYSNGKLFKAHSVILSVYSIFFQQLAKFLDYDLKGVFVLIKGFEIRKMEAFLDYMYTGEAKFEGNDDEFCESMRGWLDFSVLPVSSPKLKLKLKEIPQCETSISKKQEHSSSCNDVLNTIKINTARNDQHCEDSALSCNSSNTEIEVQNEKEVSVAAVKCERNEDGVEEKKGEMKVERKNHKQDKNEHVHTMETESEGSDIDDPGDNSESEAEEQRDELNTPKKAQKNKEQINFECQTCKKWFLTRSNFKDHLQIHPRGKVLECSFCEKEFERPSQMQLHLRTHTGAKPFQCDVCGVSFACKSATKKHRDTHTLKQDKTREFICEICQKVFSRKEYLDEHARTHTGFKPFKCDICSKSFVGKTGLNHHKKTHAKTEEKKNVVCEICGRSYTRHSLWTHMKHHKKEHRCEYCSKSFATIAALTLHVEGVHLGHAWHRCDSCGKGFMQKSHLVRHMKIHDEVKVVETFSCTECPSKFRDKSKLKMHHKQKHSGNGAQTFSCSICSKRFQCKSSVVFHQRLHFGERPHRCSMCGKTFARPYLLRDHISLHHSEEKLFQCSVCKKKCATQALLNKHLLIHKPSPTPKTKAAGPFVCTSCNKTFPTKLALSNHSRTHNYSRPFECSVCRKAFRYQESLMKHLRQHGKNTSSDSSNAKELPCIYTIQVCRPSFSQVNSEIIPSEDYVNESIIQEEVLRSDDVVPQAIPVVNNVLCLNMEEKNSSDIHLLQLKPVEESYLNETILDSEMSGNAIPDYALSSAVEKSEENIAPQSRRPFSITIDGNLCCSNILSTDGDIPLIQNRDDMIVPDMLVPSQTMLNVVPASDIDEISHLPSSNENNSDFTVTLP